MDARDSNFYVPITHAKCMWGGVPKLTQLTQFDLFEMSKKNGLKMSPYEFFGEATGPGFDKKPTLGGFLVLDPTDFDLPDELVPGSTANLQCGYTVKIKNTDSVPLDCEIIVIYQYDGIFYTNNGSSQQQVALFQRTDVMSACQSVSLLITLINSHLIIV